MKQWLANRLLRYLFPTVDPNEVITVDKRGIIYLNSQAITETEHKNLLAEVQTLRQFRLWKIMQETIKHQAQRVMFQESKDFEDMKSGKMMLYNLDVLQRIMDNIDKTK